MTTFDNFDDILQQRTAENARSQEQRGRLRARYDSALADASTDQLLTVLNEADQAKVELFDAMDAQVAGLRNDALALDKAQKSRIEFDQELASFLNQTQTDAQDERDLPFAEMTGALTSLQKSARNLRAHLNQISPTLTEPGGLRAIWQHEDNRLQESLEKRNTRWSELADVLANQTQQALRSQDTDRAGELIRTLAEWTDMPDHPIGVALAVETAQSDYFKNWGFQVQERRQAAAALRERAAREGLIIDRRLALLGEAHEKLLEAEGLKADVIAPERIAATQEDLQADIRAVNESIEGARGDLWASVGAYLANQRKADLGKHVHDWEAANAPEVKREQLALFHNAFVGAELPPDFLMAYTEWVEERTSFRRTVEDALRMANDSTGLEHVADMDALSVQVKDLWQRLEATEAPDASEIAVLQTFDQRLSARVAQHAEQIMDRVKAVLDQGDLTQDRLDAQQIVLEVEVVPLKSLSPEQRRTLCTLQKRIADSVPPDLDVKQVLTYLSDLATATHQSQLRFYGGKISALQGLDERRFKGDYSSVSPEERSALRDKIKQLLDAIERSNCAEEVGVFSTFPTWLQSRYARLDRDLQAGPPVAAAPIVLTAESQSVQEPMQADSAVTNDEAAQ